MDFRKPKSRVILSQPCMSSIRRTSEKSIRFRDWEWSEYQPEAQASELPAISLPQVHSLALRAGIRRGAWDGSLGTGHETFFYEELLAFLS